MSIKWKNGIYSGEVNQNGVPHGRGVLELENGAKKGIFENGELTLGCEYVGDELYQGGYGKDEKFHGKGFFLKDNGRKWQGIWNKGDKTEGEGCDKLPNSVYVGEYYKGICTHNESGKYFPQKGKMHREGYTDMTRADKYEMPVLTKHFGTHIVCAVEKANNRYDYSKSYNHRAMLFAEPDAVMYTDALVCGWSWLKGDYVPFDYKLAEQVCDYICETLANQNNEKKYNYGKRENEMRGWAVTVLPEGIYKGELRNGVPHGRGRIVYNHDDKEGRACYIGLFEKGLPHGSYAEMYFRDDAPDGKRYYKGDFENGVFHGRGDLLCGDGYQGGTFAKGALNGECCRMRVGGMRWQGKFADGEIIDGTLEIEEKGSKYVGPFVNMLPHGKGKETIGEDAWTGYFSAGHRLVGDSENAEKNAIELYDPFTAIPIAFNDFSQLSFSLHLVCDNVEFVSSEKLEALGKKVGARLCLAITDKKKTAPNSLVKALFDIEAFGGAILCGEDGGALCKRDMDDIMKYIEAEIARLKKAQSFDSFTLGEPNTILKKSEWVVTDETHDDYPLEAYEEYKRHYHYVGTFGKELYLVSYEEEYLDWWAANESNSLNSQVTVYTWVSAHRLPDGMTDAKKATEYAKLQNKWSKKVESGRFDGTPKELSALGNRHENLLSTLFGKKLKENLK